MREHAGSVQTPQPIQFGKYLLLDRIGTGGMAEIWRARQYGAAGFEKELVIKKILHHLADNNEFVRMFIDEAKLAVSLHHPNVVQVFDLGSVQHEYFIAMEYVFGKDLLNLLVRCTRARIRIPQKLAVFIVAEMLKGLDAAHNAVDSHGNPLQIIHRDVSPSNILISYEGQVKIGDFGVAKATRRESATRTGTMKGKLGYMSPEQVMGKEIDHRADLFSTGIILYEMLAMNRLFNGKTELETLMMVRDCKVDDAVDRLPPEVPPTLRKVLKRALARDRDKRFQTSNEFNDVLLDHLFNERQRVTHHDMGRFMKSVFDREIEAELRRRKAVDKLTSGRSHTWTPVETGEPPVGTDGPATSMSGEGGAGPGTPSWRKDSRFRVRDREGIVYGPMGINTLSEIVRRDGLEAAEEVSVDGADWASANALPGLLGSDESEHGGERAPDFGGHFNRRSFPRLLYRYAVCNATGRMVLESGTKRKEIFWRHGRPEYVTSNLRQELLGEFLVSQSLITRAQLNKALTTLTQYGGRLGDALVHLDLIAPQDLFNALGQQVKAKLLELFSWSEGRYAFYKRERPMAQIVPLELGAFPIIIEGVSSSVLAEDFEDHFSGREQLRFYRCDHKMISSADLNLSSEQRQIWNLVGHGHAIAKLRRELGQRAGAQPVDVHRVLFLMEQLDFAKVGEEVRATA